MKFTLTIKLGSEAMQSFDDIREELRNIARMLPCTVEPESGDGSTIFDHNGNNVGKWEVED